MEITDRAEYDEHKLKAVDSIVKDGITAQSDSIKLAWWIRENYGSTMIAALKTVLPVKKKLKQVVRRTKGIITAIPTSRCPMSASGMRYWKKRSTFSWDISQSSGAMRWVR